MWIISQVCRIPDVYKRQGVDLTHLQKYPNIVFHGLVPQPELPAYLAQMDVCLNVFRAGALSKDVSPLKFYEYLATGKPVVSTREPLQVEDFKDVVYIDVYKRQTQKGNA